MKAGVTLSGPRNISLSSPGMFRPELSLGNLPSSESVAELCRPAVVKSIVNDVRHVI